MHRDDHDLSVPLFFLSYARAPDVLHANGPQQDPDGYVVEFFNDLSRDVAELAPRMPGAEPGFMDRSMQAGGRWTDELLQAVGGCQVFVALLSAAYVRSEWCGMEWHAFSQRKVNAGTASNQTCIIPVTWAPVPNEHIPGCVQEVQQFSPADMPTPDMASRYKHDGVFGLRRMGLDTAYKTVVWRLAQRISHIYLKHSVEQRTLDRTELRNVFQEQDGVQHLPGARQ
jgi:hypothetical protein